jgi:hypothetical protein
VFNRSRPEFNLLVILASIFPLTLFNLIYFGSSCFILVEQVLGDKVECLILVNDLTDEQKAYPGLIYKGAPPLFYSLTKGSRLLEVSNKLSMFEPSFGVITFLFWRVSDATPGTPLLETHIALLNIKLTILYRQMIRVEYQKADDLRESEAHSL